LKDNAKIKKMTQKRITDDLNALLDVLPARVTRAVIAANNSENLLEIVLDLGRLPVARFVNSEVTLSEDEVTRTDIDFVVSKIGEFDADNRAGIERTLHRISAIRNRHDHIVGLTCRVGRAVYGTIEIIEDLVESGQSILILGKPGVGKTTMLREAARILAQKHRVVIVDTSNEIGGDGDVPHPAVGQARRMQVPKPSLQHEVMIEAVENHNPEVIVIDEIGRELEALAARTIAERGVQLIGTAHGNGLENLLLNPTLSDLVGGIESVTLSDDEPGAGHPENGAGTSFSSNIHGFGRNYRSTACGSSPGCRQLCGCDPARLSHAARGTLSGRVWEGSHRQDNQTKYAHSLAVPASG